MAVGWQSEQMVTLPPWLPGEGALALLERVRDEAHGVEDFSSLCWWILSALDSFEGKEEPEQYYARL